MRLLFKILQPGRLEEDALFDGRRGPSAFEGGGGRRGEHMRSPGCSLREAFLNSWVRSEPSFHQGDFPLVLLIELFELIFWVRGGVRFGELRGEVRSTGAVVPFLLSVGVFDGGELSV